MHEAEGVNFKVGVAGESAAARPQAGRVRGYRHNNPNLEDIVGFIGRLSLPEGDKQRLLKASSRIPHGALAKFRDNYMNYLRKEG